MVAILGERGLVIPSLQLPENIPPYSPILESSPELDPDGISYKIMRPDDFYAMTRVLIGMVSPHRDKYQAVVYPLRGGVFPGIAVASALELPAYPIGAKLYRRGIEARMEAASHKLEIYHDLPAGTNLKGRDVLLVDDVNHTSSTLNGLIDHLMKRHKAKSLTTATLHDKPELRGEGNGRPSDFVVENTTSWIIYQWEHLGSVGLDGQLLHQPYEFMVEKFPVWMIRELDGVPFCESIHVSMRRAQAIGFRENELPPLSHDFIGRLSTGLNNRYQDLFDTRIPINTWNTLLPEVEDA